MNENNNKIYEIILNPIDIYFIVFINYLLNECIKEKTYKLVKVFKNVGN